MLDDMHALQFIRLGLHSRLSLLHQAHPARVDVKFFHSNVHSFAGRISLQKERIKLTSTFLSFRENISKSRWYRTKNEILTQRSKSLGRGGIPHFSARQDPPWKRWLNRWPPEFIMWGILGLNGLVFLGWQVAQSHIVSCQLKVAKSDIERVVENG